MNCTTCSHDDADHDMFGICHRIEWQDDDIVPCYCTCYEEPT